MTNASEHGQDWQTHLNGINPKPVSCTSFRLCLSTRHPRCIASNQQSIHTLKGRSSHFLLTSTDIHIKISLRTTIVISITSCYAIARCPLMGSSPIHHILLIHFILLALQLLLHTHQSHQSLKIHTSRP